MQLWQMDIVGGVMLVDGSECKVVTGVDDHSRFCVIAAVVVRATGRATCAAFAAALVEFGVPEEVLTDNGKQFTGRFGRARGGVGGLGGEVLFDRICRENGITHRLTAIRSPTTTGKVERLHLTLRRELLDGHEPFTDLAAAQAAIDRWRADYNTARPHQSLEMATPASQFTPAADVGLELRLPPGLISVTGAGSEAATEEAVPEAALAADALAAGPGLAVESERVVPASGNLAVRGQQFWFGPDRAGTTVTLWADTTVIHLLIGGHRLKTAPSRLSLADLQWLRATGGRPAGPPPLPSSVNVRPGRVYSGPIEVERLVNIVGCISIGRRTVPIGTPLAGRRVTLRLDGTVLQVIDQTDGPTGQRVLLRSIAFALTTEQLTGIRGARPAGPPPQPAAELLRVERRVDSRGSIMVAKQKIHVGIQHAGRTVVVEVNDDTFTVSAGGHVLRAVGRTSRKEVARFKARKPEGPRKIV